MHLDGRSHTDSEEYREGKLKESERDPEIGCLQADRSVVPLVSWVREKGFGRLKPIGEGIAKASVKRH